jgi:AcrR family transcriptional regulator
MARVTTKQVAAEADCSEASIYYHFRDRTDLIAEVVAARTAELTTRLGDLPLSPQGSATERLAALTAAVAETFAELIGLSSPLFADPQVLERFRAVLVERSLSLHGIQATVAARLGEEQRQGRLREDVDVHTVALLIVGACHEVALEAHLMGQARQFTPDQAAARIAATLGTLLIPPPAPTAATGARPGSTSRTPHRRSD